MPLTELRMALSRSSPVMLELNYLLQPVQPLHFLPPVSLPHIEKQEMDVGAAIIRLHSIKKKLGRLLSEQISRLLEKKPEEELQRAERIVEELSEEHLLFIQTLESMRKRMEDDQDEMAAVWIAAICEEVNRISDMIHSLNKQLSKQTKRLAGKELRDLVYGNEIKEDFHEAYPTLMQNLQGVRTKLAENQNDLKEVSKAMMEDTMKIVQLAVT
ncbi:MAG: hypothetical protein Q9212_001536 [Teloschistes hypoglaucus]